MEKGEESIDVMFGEDNPIFEPQMEQVLQVIPVEEEPKQSSLKVQEEDKELINCLRDEKVSLKLVVRDSKFARNHPYYGEMVQGATNSFTVPLLRNGTFKNPLTTAEKDFLEDYMGLEPNALSVHKPVNNYWANRTVTVDKEGTILDLSTPTGYIDYKILLTNSDLICPSVEELKLRPKATYKFVMVSDKQIYDNTVQKIGIKSSCWKAYGKIENDEKTLRSIIKALTGRAADRKAQIEFLQNTVVELLESRPREFLDVVNSPLLPFRVLIEEGVERKVIDRRGDYYYYCSEPLCGKDENPTITVASKYISNPRNQEILFSIQAKLK